MDRQCSPLTPCHFGMKRDTRLRNKRQTSRQNKYNLCKSTGWVYLDGNTNIAHWQGQGIPLLFMRGTQDGTPSCLHLTKIPFTISRERYAISLTSTHIRTQRGFTARESARFHLELDANVSDVKRIDPSPPPPLSQSIKNRSFESQGNMTCTHR